MTHKHEEPATKATAKAPKWVRQTPDECSYSLTMYDMTGDSIPDQTLSLTREQFEFLKHQLAVKRGYVMQEDAGAESPNCSETPCSRVAAEFLIESARRACAGYLRGADPSELSLLIKSLDIAQSNLSLLYGIAVNLDSEDLLREADKSA